MSFHPLLFGSAKRSLYLINGPKRGLHTCAQREKTATSSSEKPFSHGPNSSACPSPSPPELRAQASCQRLPSASFGGCSGSLVSTTLWFSTPAPPRLPVALRRHPRQRDLPFLLIGARLEGTSDLRDWRLGTPFIGQWGKSEAI